MKRRKDIFNAFFKAQDRFQLAAPSGFEPDVIHDYIHWGMVLSSSYEHEAEDENLLLCELFLRQVYFHLLEAIQDPTRTRTFRRVCLDSVHTPYHEIAEQMVSEKFRQVLLPFELPRVDFYPTEVTNGDKVWSSYFMMHIWNNYRAIHQGRSVIDGTYVKNDFFLESLSLDETVLDKIPFEERLVFTLDEDPKFLFHETVVDALKAANLTGVGFIRVDQWGPAAMFSDDDFGDL